MNHLRRARNDGPVEILNEDSASSIVLVCEHASANIPPEFGNLGLVGPTLQSHIAWDPGARGVAMHMASCLNATLVASRISRLVYDCNRPPDAPDAIPVRSEVHAVPGNADLEPAQKARRVAAIYEPFRAAVSAVMSSKPAPVLVTIHSFTPVFHGKPRAVEIGILHDRDARLADALLAEATLDARYAVRRNEPYGPEHGVTHTLKAHAIPGDHLNVMIEIRNNLIADEPAQSAMADLLSGWLVRALAKLEAGTCKP